MVSWALLYEEDILTVCADQLHGICIVVGQSKVGRNMLLQPSSGILEICRNVYKDIFVAEIANARDQVVETRVVSCKSVVLATTLWYDDEVEEMARGVVCQLRVRHFSIGRAKEAQSPVDLTFSDARLACGA
jgi:hypothetical protein